MQLSFRALSLSYKESGVELREAVHMEGEDSNAFADLLRDTFGLEETLLISTCNRTEIYYSSEHDLSEEIIQLLCVVKNIKNKNTISAGFRRLNNEIDAVTHLFEVSMGLESQVLGDLQISNQIKQAYSQAVERKMAGPFLHRLMHTIFHTNKRVQQETAYRDGAASVSYAAAELAKELCAFHGQPSVLVVGLGEMGADVARNLAGGNFSEIALMNRSQDKAEWLASETGFRTIPFHKFHDAITEFNIVISAVSSEEPIVTKKLIAESRRPDARYFIDLSVPRSIAPDVEKVAGVIRYDIDDIKARTDETLQRRKEAIPAVRNIIAEELDGFKNWSKELTISPTIQKIKDALEQIRKEEMARYLKNAEGKETELVDKVTKSMMNKIIKLPVLHLKAACKRGEQETLIDVLNDLFDLENSKEKA